MVFIVKGLGCHLRESSNCTAAGEAISSLAGMTVGAAAGGGGRVGGGKAIAAQHGVQGGLVPAGGRQHLLHIRRRAALQPLIPPARFGFTGTLQC